MAVTLDKFVRNIIDSGLMTEQQYRSFEGALGELQRPKSIQDLALALVESNRLTRYQANMLAQNKVNGLILGNYEVLDILGKGGMGLVFKARHRRMDRVVAVKVLPPKATKDEEQVRRFHREVRAAAKLTHPNIVSAFDADEAVGVHFLVMEFVDGRDLAGLVKSTGPLPLSTAIDYIIQAAQGLDHAHNSGIVHRDIKPSNLLLDKSGVVKVLDMGLARFDDAFEPRAVAQSPTTQADGITESGNIMGTVDFMAPEQAMNTKRADQRADIYSLGCTLHYLLTGKAVYSGETLMEILVAHQMRPIPSLRIRRSDVPQELDAIYRKMLAKQPEDRFQSMAEVITVLTPYLSDENGAGNHSVMVGVPVPAEVDSATWLSSLGQPQTKAEIDSSTVTTSSKHRDVTQVLVKNKKKEAKKQKLEETAARDSSKNPWALPLAIGGIIVLGVLSTLAFVMLRSSSSKTTTDKASMTGATEPERIGGGASTNRPKRTADSDAGNLTPESKSIPPAVVPNARQRTVLFVISNRDFWYDDYKGVRDEMESKKIKVVVASSTKRSAMPNVESGATFGPIANVQPDLAIWEAKNSDYDAIIISGAVGSGLTEFDGNSQAGAGLKSIVTEMLKQHKPIAAICGGPGILAATGVLRGIEVTHFPQNEMVRQRLEAAGAKRHPDVAVRIDGDFITGQSWQVAEEFSKALVDRLEKQSK